MKLLPDSFPIDDSLAEILNELNKNQCLLVKAETGAGKTTRLPPYICEHTDKKVLVLEPRRLAAKLSAIRCAQILESKIGDRVGHHIRFDKMANKNTELLFITEGLFLSYLRNDPSLKDYGTIVLDEFHERSIHTDLALSLIIHLQKTSRPDLKLIVMSATLETDNLEKFISHPKVFHIKGRTFPIDIEYKTISPIEAIIQMLEDHRCSKNILVFLPGMKEIKKIERELKDLISPNIEILPLHSSLSKKDQDRAFKGSNKKIILSTNIAETSLTIPNITGVIDIGLERRASFAPWSGMPLLLLSKISKASAIQRSGRAGRIESGLTYRLYDQADYSRRENFTPPEIKRVDLSNHVLNLLNFGIDPVDFNWFEQPEERNLKRALDLLDLLEATKNGKITQKGRFLAKLPLHPRLSSMLYEVKDDDNINDILLSICIISEDFILKRTSEFHDDDLEPCDLTIQCNLLKSYHFNDKKLSDYPLSYLDTKKAKRALDLYASLKQSLSIDKDLEKRSCHHQQFKKALLAGFSDRVAQRREAKTKKSRFDTYKLCLGRGGVLSKRSALLNSKHNYVIALSATEDPKANAAIGTKIDVASSISVDDLLNQKSWLLSQERETVLNTKKGMLSLTINSKYGGLVIKSQALPPIVAKGQDLINVIIESWPWPFESDDELNLYNQKVEILNDLEVSHQCPLLTGDMFELFIHSIIDEELTYEELATKKLRSLIEEQLSPQDLYTIQELTPDSINLENSKSFQVHYDEEIPYIRARIQDLYGIKSNPVICEGMIVLKIKLLSPADRVAQVIGDLMGFWKSSWPDVKKDLKARYPKHFWPEDPINSEPMRVKRK